MSTYTFLKKYSAPSGKTIKSYTMNVSHRRISLLALLLTMCVSPLFAQMEIPVKCAAELVMTGDDSAEIRFHATIDEGWHMYSTHITGGPIAASVQFDLLEGAEAGELTFTDGEEEHHYDDMFGMEVRYFQHAVTFVQPISFVSDAWKAVGYFEYGACNDQNCLPPTHVEFSYGSALVAADNAEQTADNGAQTADNGAELAHFSPLWEPETTVAAAEGSSTTTSQSNGLTLWKIFFSGCLAGLLALVTPCVWPIIPMTVSFFLKRSKDRRKGRRDAYTYGASIVVIYVLLGLIITLLFGASALNRLSTSAVMNLFFFALLVVFGLSFLGAFEIRLPSSWSTKVDAKSEQKGGVLGIFLMAFTLTLVSFSCTGPIIGFLLVELSTSGSILAPTIGMLGFAIALALPFTLFAIFPAWLSSAPRSGGWMNSLKVVLAFIELAFSLKFFSVADLAYGWGLLNRPTFLCIWIVLSALLGCYLLGWLRFPHDEPKDHASVGGFCLALVCFSFALYMVPGLFGAPCKAVSAFAPPMSTQEFNLSDKTVHAQYSDYDLGMQEARRSGKPAMLDFSGYGCVNCRKMEQSVLSDARVKQTIDEQYVLISLMVDDKTPLAAPLTVSENGKTVILRTVGDKWSYLQRTKFGANAQPFYVLLDADGHLLAAPRSYDEDIPAFLQFLQTGIDNY